MGRLVWEQESEKTEFFLRRSAAAMRGCGYEVFMSIGLVRSVSLSPKT